MIDPKQIPDAVVEAAAKELAYTNGWRNQQGIEVCKPVALEIIAAALNAWPGAVKVYKSADELSADLILPLPEARSADAKHQQEGSDE